MKQVKFTLRRHRLNAQGYDSSGSYWGIGLPLYWYSSDEPINGNYREGFFRAVTRNAAKQSVLTQYPQAVFYS